MVKPSMPSAAVDNCTRSMIGPDPDEAIAENSDQLTEAFYNETMTNDMSKLLATRMEVSCK